MVPVLHHAAAAGRIQEIEQLLKAGADPNARDEEGRTPLHFAVEGGLEALKLLLLRGARADVRDWKGRSPLDLEIQRGGRPEMAGLLRAYGAKRTGPILRPRGPRPR